MTDSERLSRSIDRLQKQRALLLGRVEGLDQIQLDFRPSRQSWSIGQIAHHVGLGETVWQGYLKTALKKGSQTKKAELKVSMDDVPFSSRILPDCVLRGLVLLTPLSLIVKYVPRPVYSMLFAVPLIKMDAGPRMQPRHGLAKMQVLQILNEARRATLDILQPVASWDLSRIRIIHPLVGDQDAYGILELLSSHEQRHSLQMDTIKKNVSFPRR